MDREEDRPFAFVINVTKSVFLFNSSILPLVNRKLKVKCTKLVWLGIPCSLALNRCCIVSLRIGDVI